VAGLTATELAKQLDLSKGRISQLVHDGRLDGCYSGDGRARRFDLAAVTEALQRKLDPGQMLGNGAATRRRMAAVSEVSDDDDADEAPRPVRSGEALPPRDPDRYELARTQKAEEEARRLRRANAEAEHTMVLATAVHRQVARQIGQEIAEFETVLRESARRIADRLGVDYRTARQIMVETWREHRGSRSSALVDVAAAANLDDEETEADF
jgi:excisionase family DNA binding protein